MNRMLMNLLTDFNFLLRRLQLGEKTAAFMPWFHWRRQQHQTKIHILIYACDKLS